MGGTLPTLKHLRRCGDKPDRLRASMIAGHASTPAMAMTATLALAPALAIDLALTLTMPCYCVS